MREISRLRFDALAAYCRTPLTLVMADEIRWFEFGSGELVATVIRDVTDGDFGGIILARDAKERYRFVRDANAFYKTPEEVIPVLEKQALSLLKNLEDERKQGDEKGAPVDFFSPIVEPERLHPDFVNLAGLEGYSPARGIIEPMMRWYEDADGNFIEQFQTTGFDARIWELYLFALFIEAGYAINRSEPVPDFTCDDLVHELCVEATTVNATRDRSGTIV